MNKLEQIQDWCLKGCEAILRKLETNEPPVEFLMVIARESSAFHTAMREDPLLPGSLLFRGYLGEKVWIMHEKKIRRIGLRLL